MSRYIKPRRDEPTNEWIVAGWILLGPLMLIVHLAQWIQRAAR